VTFVRFIIF
jgi:hypothetical protein